MKCLYCQKEVIGKRRGAKFCSPEHKRDYHRRGKITVPQVVLDTDKIDTDTVSDTVIITPKVEEQLGEIYKKFEKENPGFKCLPYFSRGVRILTEWEKMKLKELVLSL